MKKWLFLLLLPLILLVGCQSADSADAIQLDGLAWLWVGFVGIAGIVLGLLMWRKPRAVWDWQHRWLMRDGTPTDLALRMTRFNGIVMYVLGIFCVIAAVILFLAR